jgi:glutaredoxin 3
VQLDREEDGAAYQDVLQEMTGARTVPRVFINGKCIGGGNETAAAAADGTLQKLLAA